MFLLDTNVVSETRKPKPNPSVLAWIGAADPAAVFLSVMSTGEIRKGIELFRAVNAEGAREIEDWLNAIEVAFGDRLLPVTREVADAWGTIAAGTTVDDIDVLLAATAKIHGLTLVTRNIRHVEGLGVPVLNPFQSQ